MKQDTWLRSATAATLADLRLKT